MILFLEYRWYDDWFKLKPCFDYANLDNYCLGEIKEFVKSKSNPDMSLFDSLQDIFDFKLSNFNDAQKFIKKLEVL